MRKNKEEKCIVVPSRAAGGCGPVISLHESMESVKEKVHRIDTLETAVQELAKLVSSLVESNRWLQRATLGLYGLMGGLLMTMVGYLFFK